MRRSLNYRLTDGAIGRIAFCILAIFVFTTFFATGSAIRSKRHSDAEAITDGILVEENSELIYNLDVNLDRNGIGIGDIITVTDVIPNGLEFVGFTSSDTACSEYIINDSGNTSGWSEDKNEYSDKGLHYKAIDRTVSFKVKRPKAGCDLKVGIITKTPTLAEGVSRMDFYNIARYIDNGISSYSDMTHYYIGSSDTAMYHVSYQYTGDNVPDNAPVLPGNMQYSENATVDVLQDIELDGYNFSGWISADVEVKDGQFEMPARTVVFYGGFTEKLSY